MSPRLAEEWFSLLTVQDIYMIVHDSGLCHNLRSMLLGPGPHWIYENKNDVSWADYDVVVVNALHCSQCGCIMNRLFLNLTLIGLLCICLSQDHIQEIFSTYGKIKTVEMPMDRLHPHLSRCSAYVEFETPEEAQKALKYMDGGRPECLFSSVS